MTPGADHQVSAPDWSDAGILIVDDNPDICLVMQRVLEQAGYVNVSSASDPTFFWSTLTEREPDLLLLDLHMPEIDGFSLLEQLDLRRAGEMMPVIVLTADDQPEVRRRALELGAADFLLKPVDPIEVQLRVANHLRVRGLQLRLRRHNDTLEEIVEARLRELRLFRRVIDQLMEPAAILDGGDLRFHYANPALADLLGHQIDDVIGRRLADVGDERVVSRITHYGLEVLADDGEPLRVEVDLPDVRTRRRRRMELEFFPLDTERGPAVVLLAHDIEPHRRAKETLRRALDREREAARQLRRLEELRLSFLSAVSHELRTPLTTVRGVSEMLHRRRGQLTDEQDAQLRERLDVNARKLDELLADLLDLNRLASGAAVLDPSPTRIDQLVRKSAAQVDLVGREIEFELSPVTAEVDPQKLERVVVNLLANAVRHTPSGTALEVWVAEESDSVVITVTDHGLGIPDEDKGRLFAAFEQGDTAPRHAPGTGIGLSLIESFVSLHGGRIWIEDTPGGGATFRVRLPMQAS